ncbi:hypothetical protein GH714_016315 [Hevea brasiliensis]|uniref:Beta-glucosidase n=1 Tax=Hevea brasiliensis TaxID=3981 RepID=A0A6A6N249_HEVBR|nr:hypothetical protein GH714_016315 [Hevea brasiliensis]
MFSVVGIKSNHGTDLLDRVPISPGILAVLLISLLAFTEPATILLDEEHDVPRDFSRSYFPEDFTFGVSTSAYQVEGEANKKGRGPSVWDIFARESSERIKDQSNGDVAVDFYNRYAV